VTTLGGLSLSEEGCQIHKITFLHLETAKNVTFLHSEMSHFYTLNSLPVDSCKDYILCGNRGSQNYTLNSGEVSFRSKYPKEPKQDRQPTVARCVWIFEKIDFKK
jgi:hypothetical protein